MSHFVDLSHPIVHGVQTYPGLPAPIVEAFLSHADSRVHYAKGTEFQIARIAMVANSGTYVDAPFHRYRDAPDVARLRLDQLADLDGVCIPVQGEVTGPEHFAGIDVRGKAVLVRTDFSAHWGTPRYFDAHPHLSLAAAEYLASEGALHVGIDSLNIDSRDDAHRPVHTCLLAAEIPITEHLTNLAALPATGFRYFAVPAKIEGVGSFPVRAFALL